MERQVVVEMTVDREPLLGDLHMVKVYLDDGDRAAHLVSLRTPGEILERVRRIPAGYIHFVGGRRENRTYRRANPSS